MCNEDEYMRQNNEAVKEQAQAMENVLEELKGIEHNFNEMSQENVFMSMRQQNTTLEQELQEVNKTGGKNDIMKTENESLQQQVQELTKSLCDAKEATRYKDEALQREVQELKSILQELKAFECNSNANKQENEPA